MIARWSLKCSVIYILFSNIRARRKKGSGGVPPSLAAESAGSRFRWTDARRRVARRALLRSKHKRPAPPCISCCCSPMLILRERASAAVLDTSSGASSRVRPFAPAITNKIIMLLMLFVFQLFRGPSAVETFVRTKCCLWRRLSPAWWWWRRLSPRKGGGGRAKRRKKKSPYFGILLSFFFLRATR